ncbi:hypothetical protein HWV62_10911 [Athelia sp. TMB]|nr:hypothetical protein HWV62_10911 [Athelia sp. TMB]
MSTIVRVDDTDTSINYSSNWVLITDLKNPQGYNHTQHLTRVTGSSATFTFNGTQIAVLGSYGSTGPTSQYSIDDGPPTTFTPMFNTSSEIYSQVFYTSPVLDAGEHKITIALVSGDWYWFDEFQYVPSSASTHPKAKAPVGAIIGGVIGGVVVVLGLLLLLLRWRKRRRGNHVYSPALIDEIASFHEPEVVPFTSMREATSAPDTSMSKRHPDLEFPTVASSSSTQLSPPEDDRRYPPSAYPSSQPSQTTPPPANQHLAPLIVRHDDAGIRIDGGPGDLPPAILELPPLYSYDHAPPGLNPTPSSYITYH